MTLQQLKYVVTVAETGTITEVEDKLYISQPSLTNAIRELEKESRRQFLKTSIKAVMVERNCSVFPHSIILLPSMHLWI